MCYAEKEQSTSHRGNISPLIARAAARTLRSVRSEKSNSRILIAACNSQSIGMLAACTFELQQKASREVQLLPAGAFRTNDGRPAECAAWKLDAASAAKVISKVDALKRKLVIDYEHQTLNSEVNGLPAPAAGRFKSLEWREGAGLFATDVTWTAKAKQMIENDEYLYLSPVFDYDPKTGDVIRLRHAALTNDPGLDNIGDVLARAAARFNAQPSQENNTMNKLFAAVIATLALPATATEDDAIAGVAALKTKADKTGDLETQVAALKSSSPDPTKYVPVETVTNLQTQLATLTGQVNGREIDEVVTAALKDGKLLPATEQWARDLGKKDMAALKDFIAKAPAVAALKGQQNGGRSPDAKEGELDETQLAVCKNLGISPEDYKKSLATQAA